MTEPPSTVLQAKLEERSEESASIQEATICKGTKEAAPATRIELGKGETTVTHETMASGAHDSDRRRQHITTGY